MDGEQDKIEQFIKLELNARDLYLLYQRLFKDDALFWKQAAEEEEQHAKVIEMTLRLPEEFPDNFIFQDLEKLKAMNKEIEETIAAYKKKPPYKKEAYGRAVYFENNAAELHYRQIAGRQDILKEFNFFQKLNKADKDHADKINALFSKQP